VKDIKHLKVFFSLFFTLSALWENIKKKLASKHCSEKVKEKENIKKKLTSKHCSTKVKEKENKTKVNASC
jgi:hypothetical protein